MFSSYITRTDGDINIGATFNTDSMSSLSHPFTFLHFWHMAFILNQQPVQVDMERA